MDQEKAIKLKLLSVRLEERYPEDIIPLLRQDLMEMYAVGYDEGYLNINQHGNKPIAQYRGTILITTYKSLKEAARMTGFSDKGIERQMKRGTPMKQGWSWRYLPKEEKKKPVPF